MEFEEHSISAKLYGKRKNDLVEVASSFRLHSTGTVAAIKKRIECHLKEVEKSIKREKSLKKDIAFLGKEVQPFSGGFRGQVGQLSALAPPFGNKSVPYPDANALFFQ